MNRYSETELYDLTFRVCVASVKQAFPHIPVANIIDPPRGQFDATLARQIAMHLMIGRFRSCKRCVRASCSVGKRTSINRAIEIVDARLEGRRVSKASYRIIADRCRRHVRRQTAGGRVMGDLQDHAPC